MKSRKHTKPAKQRNWVAKHDFNRAQVMRDRTRYQRRAKHPLRETALCV